MFALVDEIRVRRVRTVLIPRAARAGTDALPTQKDTKETMIMRVEGSKFGIIQLVSLHVHVILVRN